MKSTVIIFLAFASLAQSIDDYVPNLTVSYGLPDEKVSVLQTIIENQENSRTSSIKGSVGIFDTLQSLTAALAAGSEASIDSSAFETFICEAKNASDLFYDSVLLAIETSSSIVETSRTETSDILDAISEAVISALELAACGNYSEYEDAIEDYRTTVETNWKDLTNIQYDAISTSLDTTDSALLNVIEVARNGSLLGVTHLTNSYFNAIKIYAAAASGTYLYPRATCKIEAYRDKASIAHRDDVEHKFALVRAVLINANLDQSGIAVCVYESQWTDIVSLRAYIDGNIVLFKNMLEVASVEINLGIGDDGHNYYDQNDIDLAMVIAQFDEGDHRIINNSLFIHPEDATSIAETRDYIHTLNVEGDESMNNAFNIARNKSVPLSEALSAIETLRHAAVDPAPAYTQLFFDMIRSNMTFDSATETELETLQNSTIYGAQLATNSFLDAVIIMANATRVGEITNANFTAMSSYRLDAYAGLEYFSQTIAAAGLLVCNYIIAN